MTKSVDVVFTISDYLRNKKITMRPDIHVIRNGVAYEDFAHTPTLSRSSTDELFTFKTPILGYIGAISKWTDFDLIKGIADSLNEVNLVFVGRIEPLQRGITEILNRRPNIHFLGERPYRELPHYLKYFELAHIPFVLNELILSVNPIKLYEYLAAGIRVVSTPLPEVELYQKEYIIEIASGVDKYSQAIKKMLARDASASVAMCQALARENTWESRVELACETIYKKMN